MLYRHKQGTFEICQYKAVYTVKRDSVIESGVDEENNAIYKSIKTYVEEIRYIHNKEYFENILNQHEDYSNLVYEDVLLTDEQFTRYEQIRSLPESSIGHCIEYVLNGVFPKGNGHALRNIQLELENQILGQELSQREINEIIQGIQLSELEIEILKIKLGEI